MSTATAFTISHTTEHELLANLEVEFEDFRSRIAKLSVNACGVLTGMFSPLGPAELEAVIDIKAIEQSPRAFVSPSPGQSPALSPGQSPALSPGQSPSPVEIDLSLIEQVELRRVDADASPAALELQSA